MYAERRRAAERKYLELCPLDFPVYTRDECVTLAKTYAAMTGAMDEQPEIDHDDALRTVRDRARRWPPRARRHRLRVVQSRALHGHDAACQLAAAESG
jgi:hypothetical protein